VFFVVLISAISQGWSLPALANRLGLARPADPAPPVTVEINALRNVDGEIVEYTVAPSARVAGQRLKDLALPDGVLVTLVVRGEEVIMPRGGTALRPGDHVFMAMRKSLVPLIDRLFDPYAETPELEAGLELEFHRHATVGQLHRFFGIPGPTWSTNSLGALVETAGEEPARHGPFLVRPAEDEDFVRLRYEPLPAA
jgi:cell volume regulation protein A